MKIESPQKIDGISFVPVMLGKKQKAHDYLYWEFHERGGRQAVRMGKWKGVQTGKTLAVYDLETDLGEKTDIAAAHPAIAARMRKIIEELE